MMMRKVFDIFSIFPLNGIKIFLYYMLYFFTEQYILT